MDPPEVLTDIKASEFYQEHRVPKRELYDIWVNNRRFSKAQEKDLADWNMHRINKQGGPYVQVKGATQLFDIHVELIAMLRLGPAKPLDASGFDDHIVRGVIELTYHINQPFPLIHDILVSAAVPPFPSEKLDEKLGLLELAVRWRLEPVVDLLSLGMGIEQVVNIYQHAYIRYEARMNGWTELLAVCDENEKNQIYAMSVSSIVTAIADSTEDEHDRAFTLQLIEHLDID
ncbi:hypothetical protein AAF712_011273 [Marasmius tenuissimus]|uniref:Uncharacterized protein n=1 Tax=Marasmius tenuissimus TaxID=585030 RepID=A0ABR2ZL50_9AGAR